jgi:RNA polymerase sigma factor (sigma-70 family)
VSAVATGCTPLGRKRRSPTGNAGASSEAPAPALPAVEFLQANYELLSRLCLRWSRGNEADAADLLSTAVLKVLESPRHVGAEVENPLAWWRQVIVNLARDRHRGRAQRVTASSDEERWPDRADSHDLVAAREAIFRLSRSVGRLTATQREAVLLRAAGHGYREIASALGVSPDNARKLVQLARVSLRGADAAAGRSP